jgi:hypothetical protein
VVGEDLRFQGQQRCAAGDDGGLGDCRRAQNTVRKSGARVLLDMPERGEKVRRFEREGGSWTASESATSADVTCEHRRWIPAAWRLLLQREKVGAREESWGFIGAGLMAS